MNMIHKRAPIRDVRQLFGRQTNEFDMLERGRAVLQRENLLNQYLYSYGLMHEWKLKCAMTELMPILANAGEHSFDVIDYGCGQGLATLQFCSALRYELGLDPAASIGSMTLIEPSEKAIARAKNLLSGLPVVNTICGGFDELSDSVLEPMRNRVSTSVHLFSNVLDMIGNHFEGENLEKVVSRYINKTNYFVCVSPLNKYLLDIFAARMTQFGTRLDYADVSIKHPTKDWRLQMRVFKVEK